MKYFFTKNALSEKEAEMYQDISKFDKFQWLVA